MYIIFFLSTLVSLNSFANVLRAKISHIIPGRNQNQTSLILLSSGRVLQTKNKNVILSFQNTSPNDDLTFFEDQGKIITFSKHIAFEEDPILKDYYDPSLPSFSPKITPSSIRYTDDSFIPSNFNSLNEVQTLMEHLKFNRKSTSECFERAHLWSIEMLQMAEIQSGKMFLFFSEKYMREYNFNWWFHVAPFVLIQDKEFVLDSWFLNKPVEVQTWTNLFLDPFSTCKENFNYQNYEENQSDGYCFLRKLPMYYFEPSQVQDRDNKKNEINKWIKNQVSSAYGSLKTTPWIFR